MRKPKGFVNHPFEYHQEIEVKIERLANDGRGIARIDNWVVMVPFVIPGEVAKVKIFKNHSRYSEADLVEVVEKSSDRAEPLCPLFGKCGGCQYQHLTYEKQLYWKTEHVRECFERLGKISVNVSQCVPSPMKYNYRAKLTPHFEKRKNDKELPIGFLRHGSRRSIVDVPSCPIATPDINKKLDEVVQAFRSNAKLDKKYYGTLLFRDTEDGVLTKHNDIAKSKVGGCMFQYPAGEFFQNNLSILPEMVNYAISDDSENKYFVDTYCGVGLFSIFASSKYKHVIGIELNKISIALAEKNAEANGCKNVNFFAGDAEEIFEKIPYGGEACTVLIDPPRKGCSKAFLNQLIRFCPSRVVYVSCAPDTQARDLAYVIAEKPEYEIKSVQPFDLFPQTKHVESVAILELS